MKNDKHHLPQYTEALNRNDIRSKDIPNNHLGFIFNLVNDGRFQLPTSTGFFRISEPSTVLLHHPATPPNKTRISLTLGTQLTQPYPKNMIPSLGLQTNHQILTA